MPLNPKMLEECKDIIFNKSELPESVKEPVHMAVHNLIVLEYSYVDFLSREVCYTDYRADPIRSIIEVHGGKIDNFNTWFEGYEIQ
jgi:uncharacterized membrane protein